MWMNRVAVRRTVAALVHEHVLVRHDVHVQPAVFVPVRVLMRVYVKPTFLTVMFVLMQHKAVATLTNVRAHCVDALVLAAAVVLAALVFVWWETHMQHSCHLGVDSERSAAYEGVWEWRGRAG